jgi:hypothetical protein
MSSINVPKKFKFNTIQRFNSVNAVKIGAYGRGIRLGCDLCKEYRFADNCGTCPLAVFKKENGVRGCIQWIRDRINPHFRCYLDKIEWDIEKDRLVKAQLRLMLELLESDVRWVESEKQFRIKCWIPTDDSSMMNWDTAVKELKHLENLQPENIYKIEPVTEERS